MIPRLPFLPEELRQLLVFVPTHGWHAIDWRPLLRELRRISVRLATQRGVRKLAGQAGGLVDGVELRAALPDGGGIADLSARERKGTGDLLLRFYFAQWRNPHGLFLDLRPSRLAWQDGRLTIGPNGLYAELPDDFREGMRDLYLGFYRPDEELLDDALHRLGFLHDGLGAEAAGALKRLLRQHFGAASQDQHFSIDEFRESFNALFDFFVAENYRLPPSFVLVGFYLITLYISLEMLDARHDVRTLCLGELDA